MISSYYLQLMMEIHNFKSTFAICVCRHSMNLLEQTTNSLKYILLPIATYVILQLHCCISIFIAMFIIINNIVRISILYGQLIFELGYYRYLLLLGNKKRGMQDFIFLFTISYSYSICSYIRYFCYLLLIFGQSPCLCTCFAATIVDIN